MKLMFGSCKRDSFHVNANASAWQAAYAAMHANPVPERQLDCLQRLLGELCSSGSVAALVSLPFAGTLDIKTRGETAAVLSLADEAAKFLRRRADNAELSARPQPYQVAVLTPRILRTCRAMWESSWAVLREPLPAHQCASCAIAQTGSMQQGWPCSGCNVDWLDLISFHEKPSVLKCHRKSMSYVYPRTSLCHVDSSSQTELAQSLVFERHLTMGVEKDA